MGKCGKYLVMTETKGIMRVCIYKIMPEDAKPAVGGFRAEGG